MTRVGEPIPSRPRLMRVRYLGRELRAVKVTADWGTGTIPSRSRTPTWTSPPLRYIDGELRVDDRK